MEIDEIKINDAVAILSRHNHQYQPESIPFSRPAVFQFFRLFFCSIFNIFTIWISACYLF